VPDVPGKAARGRSQSSHGRAHLGFVVSEPGLAHGREPAAAGFPLVVRDAGHGQATRVLRRHPGAVERPAGLRGGGHRGHMIPDGAVVADALGKGGSRGAGARRAVVERRSADPSDHPARGGRPGDSGVSMVDARSRRRCARGQASCPEASAATTREVAREGRAARDRRTSQDVPHRVRSGNEARE